ncbi:putative cystine transporter YijE [Usitatibacter palustris]|uniref:Putative cystine transporter YijE n=2 Tax=Usitatibacter palustris TaxID=2732487 RepID=A0A6M4H6P4_9PROT|nr:putative cystine transporter YijE [Usitatibacter palustris]
MVLIWGYSWIVMKIGLRHAHPFDFAAWRVGLGAAFLFLIIKLTGRSLTLSGYRMAVVLGFLQVALFVALSHFALLLAGPGKTSVLVFTMPFWMIVFAHFIIGERMRGAQWIAVALAFAGLTLIVAPWELTSLEGSLLAVAAGAVWALSAVLSKRWPVAGADPLTFTAWQLLFGFFVLATLATVHPHEPVRWTKEFLLALGFSTVFATAIGWWLWTRILATTPAGITGLNALGIPVVAVLASWAQLGERPPPMELAGMACIGIALALLAFLSFRSGTPASAVPGAPPRS